MKPRSISGRIIDFIPIRRRRKRRRKEEEGGRGKEKE